VRTGRSSWSDDECGDDGLRAGLVRESKRAAEKLRKDAVPIHSTRIFCAAPASERFVVCIREDSSLWDGPDVEEFVCMMDETPAEPQPIVWDC